MAESAEDRRARLLAMRQEAAIPTDDNNNNNNNNNSGNDTPSQDEAEEEKEVKIKLRNYIVKDAESIKHERVASAVAPDLTNNYNISKNKNTSKNNDNDEAILATKANADLKRDVAKKLDILEKKTQAAMIEVRGERKRDFALAFCTGLLLPSYFRCLISI